MKPSAKPKKSAAPPPRPKARPAEKKSGTVPFRFSAILFNVAGAVAAILFINFFFEHHEPDPANPTALSWNIGYDHMYNTMLAGNLKQIAENPDKSIEDKYLLKWGPGEIVYVNQMKAKVPENGIILLPPHEFFRKVGFVMTRNGPVLQEVGQPNCTKFSMIDIPWITYFLYPRQVVYGDSVNSPLYAKADYLASFNGWGLEKLNYKVEKPEQFMILPIKK